MSKQERRDTVDELVNWEMRVRRTEEAIIGHLRESGKLSVQIAKDPKTGETLELCSDGQYRVRIWLGDYEGGLCQVPVINRLRTFAEMTEKPLLNYPELQTAEDAETKRFLTFSYRQQFSQKISDNFVTSLERVAPNQLALPIS